MIDWLLAPLQYEFMIRGLLASVTVGIVCGVLGTYVVLRGMAFFGDALAHAILPGVAIAYLIGGGAQGALFVGALVAGIVTALAIGALAGADRSARTRPSACCSRRCLRWASR